MAEQNAGPVVVQTTAQQAHAEKPAPVVEKPAPVVEPDAKAKELEEKFKAFTAKDREILAARQKIKQDQDAHAASVAKHAKDLEEAATTKARLERAKLDPEGALKELFGPDWYDHTVALKLDKKAPTDLRVDAVLSEVESLKKKLADRDVETARERKAQEDAQRRQAVEDFNKGAIGHVKAAGDKYELINALGFHDNVPEVIRQHWADQNEKLQRGEISESEMKLLSVDDAAKIVEDWCESIAEKAKGTKRLTTKWTSAHTPARKSPEGTSREVRSLSNDLTGTARQAPPAETDAERRKRADAAFDAVIAAKKAQAGG